MPDSEFVLIQPGTFQMGDAENGPAHAVTLTHSYWMQRALVTQAQWAAVMGSNPSNFKACGSTCPVENVSYDDVQAFIVQLNERTPGKKYRLPTEAEWEYAARAGTTGEYGVPGAVTDGGWIADNSGGTTHPVGVLRPNAWGLYDMEGNIWEWVYDWYAPYTAIPSTNPTGPTAGTRRVLRGGAWYGDAASARSTSRDIDPPVIRFNGGGFRLARTP